MNTFICVIQGDSKMGGVNIRTDFTKPQYFNEIRNFSVAVFYDVITQQWGVKGEKMVLQKAYLK